MDACLGEDADANYKDNGEDDEGLNDEDDPRY
jgi:hypothetical protein